MSGGPSNNNSNRKSLSVKPKGGKDGNLASFGSNKERIVHCNAPNTHAKFASNYISTTKYSILTFLPKNLFEQFRKVVNVYFLLICIVQLLPGVSPISPYTSISPLVFVLTVSAIKEAIEDLGRYRSDKEVNARQVDVLMNGVFTSVKWDEVAAGSIVRVKNKEFFPADLICLWTSNEAGACYVETSNLDGETNLKTRVAPNSIYTMVEDGLKGGAKTAHSSEMDRVFAAFKMDITCELPNNSLYTFVGNATVAGGEKVSLDPQNLLLRGAKLCNTNAIIGTAVFTGKETKVMKNLTQPPSKRSSLDRAVDRQVFIIFGIQFGLAALCAILSAQWTREHYPKHWYLHIGDSPTINASMEGLKRFFTFVILFNTMVPISLIVSIEIVKVVQAYLINSDEKMYHKETTTWAKARTSALNEELGQVEYIFSDKTGTLTQNRMDFKYCSIGGMIYQSFPSEYELEMMKKEQEANSAIGGRSASRPQSIRLSTHAMGKGPVIEPASKAAGEEVKVSSAQDMLQDLASGDGTTDGRSSKIRWFFSLMSICHTVVPSSGNEDDQGSATAAPKSSDKGKEAAAAGKKPDMLKKPGAGGNDSGDDIEMKHLIGSPALPEIQAESPDEAALVEASAKFGFVFHTRTAIGVTFWSEGANHFYEILNTNVFNSTRKRMSVVCRCPDGKLRLFCKGADNVIIERLAEDSPHTEETKRNLKVFAQEGLRTLCMSYKEISQEFYDAWNKEFQDALCSIENREDKLADAAEKIEKDMILLGATGIEDKLQDGVPDAIYQLGEAGLKIWVLTGDKLETAINIGYSCKLLKEEMTVITMLGETIQDANDLLNGALKKMEDDKKAKIEVDYGVVIDGHTLDFVLKPELIDVFVDLTMKCKAVICCRVTPIQKALTVKMVKKKLQRITLAIGDGANDVSMIRAAHLGIGISGNEGMQAAMASDYSIAQFRFLLPLLLVHGRWSYKRVAKLILFSFYKNMAFSMTQFWFGFYSGFSGQTLYDGWYLAVYNVTSTALPVMVYAIFDQDVNKETSLANPPLYMSGQRRESFNTLLLTRWLLAGIVQSLALFFIPFLGYEHEVSGPNGKTIDIWARGALGYTCALLTVNIKISLDGRYWTIYNFGAVSITTVFWFLFLWAYTTAYSPLSADSLGGFTHAFKFPIAWFLIIITIFIALLPDFFAKAWKRNFDPRQEHILQEAQRMNRNRVPKLREMTEKNTLLQNGSGGTFI